MRQKRRMNLRHAGALSLVGWYLMVPPLQFVSPGNDPYSLAIVDDAAPLPRWLPMMTFKTLQECDNFSTRLAGNMRKERQNRAGQKGCRDAHRDLARQISVCRNRRPAPQGEIARGCRDSLKVGMQSGLKDGFTGSLVKGRRPHQKKTL